MCVWCVKGTGERRRRRRLRKSGLKRIEEGEARRVGITGGVERQRENDVRFPILWRDKFGSRKARFFWRF